MDRLLRLLVSKSMRRGLAGEPLWLAVAGAAWLVRRGSRQRSAVAWRGRLGPGERLVIDVTDPRVSRPVGAGGE